MSSQPNQELLDLDALAPSTFQVLIRGVRYDVLPGDGLPVAAAFDAARISNSTGQDQMEACIGFLAKYCGLPLDALRTLSKDQLGALFGRIFPAPEVAGRADPRPATTAQGIPGSVLGAQPCKLP